MENVVGNSFIDSLVKARSGKELNEVQGVVRNLVRLDDRE